MNERFVPFNGSGKRKAQSEVIQGILLNPPQFNGLLIVDESILNSLRDSVALLNLAENW